jgi:hypothetical protein
MCHLTHSTMGEVVPQGDRDCWTRESVARRYHRKKFTCDDAREIIDNDGLFLCKNDVGKFSISDQDDICYNKVLLVMTKLFAGNGAVWD